MSSPYMRRFILICSLTTLALFATAPSPASAAAGTWTLLPNGPRASGASNRHDDIYFINATTGWVVNGNGDVWRTTDGGDGWSLLTHTGGYNRCVGFADTQNGWIGLLHQVNGEMLLQTQNGGATWQTVPLPEPKPQGLCGLYVVNPNTICAVGAYYGYPRFVRSDDAGATWTVRDMTYYCGALVDTYWFDTLNGIAVGSTTPGANRRPRILRTTDGGVTWSVRWTGTRDNELCWKISFVDAQIGFVSIENLSGVGASYFLKTMDGGQTWTEMLFQPTYLNCQGIGFVTENDGWIGGWNIGTYITADGGQSWTWKNFGYNVNRIRFLSPFLGYACGRDVYKYTVSPSGVGEPPPPTAIQLSQNQPNPFSGSTAISYRVTEAGPVSLRVFDLHGRLVRELFSGERGVGQFTDSFDATGLPAGSYYYQLRTPAGDQTRKMQVLR